MKALKKNDLGVSPVIAVILMVAITVVLAGVVFLWAQSFTDDTGGGVETLNIKATATYDYDGTDFENDIVFETMGGSVVWTDYEIKVANGTSTSTISTASVDTSNAGDTTTFSSVITGEGSVVRTGGSINVKIINIGDNQVVWENDLRVTNA